MRTFKFRAWDKSKGKMGTPFLPLEEMSTYDPEQNVYDRFPNICVFMQYTGLNDKDGKEIYEGDIVRILYTDWPSQPAEKNGKYNMSLEDYKKSISNIGVVEFFVGNAIAEYKLSFGDYYDRLNEGRHGEKEIIGNIYENPEFN